MTPFEESSESEQEEIPPSTQLPICWYKNPLHELPFVSYDPEEDIIVLVRPSLSQSLLGRTDGNDVRIGLRPISFSEPRRRPSPLEDRRENLRDSEIRRSELRIPSRGKAHQDRILHRTGPLHRPWLLHRTSGILGIEGYKENCIAVSGGSVNPGPPSP